MVSVSNETELEKYLQLFEKVAVNLEWPKKVWPVLLQSVPKGQVQETYSSLCEEESFDYEKVKMAILKAYELVPVAYRQKFHTFRKRENQTFVEFAHEKKTYFDRWCNTKQVRHEFDRLRQVIYSKSRKGVSLTMSKFISMNKMYKLWQKQPQRLMIRPLLTKITLSEKKSMDLSNKIPLAVNLPRKMYQQIIPMLRIHRLLLNWTI